MSAWNYLRIDHNSQIPLATQLSQQLKRLIVSEAIEKDSKLPPVRQLGEQLGINFHTVRAAYQQLEAQGLATTRHGIGTVVLGAGKAIPSIRTSAPTFAIGVVIPAFTDFYGPLLKGVQDAASDDPSLFFICDTREDADLAEYYLDQLIARDVDGIILVSREIRDRARAVTISQNRTSFPPVVFADIPTYPQPLVLFDLEGGAHMAAAHMLDHGHRRVGVITPPLEWQNNAEKFKGFGRAFSEAGVALNTESVAIVPDFTLESGHRGAQQLIDQKDGGPITGILAASAKLAIGALKAIRERGLKVPDDIALIAADDQEIAALIEPPLTALRLPAYEMGVQSYLALRQLIEGQTPDRSAIRLGTDLIIRQSCGCNPPD
jgi:DNA-binding LacI/PurR family transcriptional regulator